MSKNPVTSRLKAVLLGATGAVALLSLMGPRSGTGDYSLPAGNPVSSGTVISATVHNNTMADIASALTQSLSKDGQTTVTGNIPFGGFKATNVADANARNQWAAAGQVQDGELLLAGSVSGTDTITASLAPAITSYATGMVVALTPAGSNTGAATIALNGLSAKSVVKYASTALVAGDLVSTATAYLLYNGTNFQLLNPQHPVANDEVTFARMQNIATDRLVGRDTASSGDPEEITVGGGLEFTGSTGIQRSALTGDVTASAGSGSTTIASGAVTNAKLADMAQTTIKGRASGAGTGDPTDLTASQVVTIINTADGASSGLDSDLLDGQHGSYYRSASNLNAGTIPDAQVATSGSFTATLTGMSGATTGTIHWTRVGGMVELRAESGILGTSNANTLTLTGLPSELRPAAAVNAIPCTTRDNGSDGLSFASISATGSTITFNFSFISGTKVLVAVNQYTTSGQKGLSLGWRLSYDVS